MPGCQILAVTPSVGVQVSVSALVSASPVLF